MKKVYFDVEKVPISLEGISDYFSLYSVDDYLETWNQLRQTINLTIRELQSEYKDLYSSCLSVLSLFLIIELMEMRISFDLVQRANLFELEIIPAPYNKRLSALLNHQEFPTPTVLNQLRNGPPVPSEKRAMLRFFSDIFFQYKESIVRRSFKGNFKKISLITKGLPSFYAKINKIDVLYLRTFQCFESIPTVLNTLSLENDTALNYLLERSYETLESQGWRMPLEAKSHMHNWMLEASKWVIEYSKRCAPIIQKYEEIWLPCGSNLWGRIVAATARRVNIPIVRFCHAKGTAYFTNAYFSNGTLDFEDCDRYITSTKAQAEHIEKEYKHDQLIQDRLPFIQVIEGKKNKINTRPKKIKRVTKELRSILYVPALMFGEIHHPSRRMSDYMLFDWQIRLVAKLKEWGYDVTLKPHPIETRNIEPSHRIATLLSVNLAQDKFEKIANKYDVIILDQSKTSLFPFLVSSDIPFVFIDFKIDTFCPDAMQLLNKRCPVVGGFFQNNRAEIDWEQLKLSIATSRDYISRDFYNTYFCYSSSA